MKEFNFNIEIAKKGKEIVSIEKYRFTESKITFLFGESGIGKTLANKAIFGLLDESLLDVKINGLNYSAFKKHEVCRDFRNNGFFVFQEPSSHLNPLIKISEQMNEGDIGGSRNDKEVLEQLWRKQFDSFYKNVIDIYPKPYRPSGGEKQRVLAAMAFKKLRVLKNYDSRNLYVFDEPTGNLDNYFRNVFIDNLIEQYIKHRFTSVFITHDYSIVAYIQKRYSKLLSDIEYKELYRAGEKSKLRKFDSAEFLKYDFKKLARNSKGSGQLKLAVKSGIKVFERELIFSKNEDTNYRASLKVNSGEITYLKAPSGEGKTTILKIIMGLVKADEFAIRFEDKIVDQTTLPKFWSEVIWGKVAGIVFQHADEALNLNSKVKEVFQALPLEEELTDLDIISKLNEIFDEEITEEFINKKTGQLSGGQKQKINLLRTFMLDTDIILLDEPTSGMDFNSIKKFLVMLQKKLKENKAILLVSHNEDIFDPLVDEENRYYLKTTD
ncbi:MAG: ABC transporter ATP-binding protein [Melioribacteraceae bacterium]|nr:MAG: ABC transporter ATP-binding protein [Melioribacteraceae bacterium]